mmetsp:Transcript_36453/g.114270  ORF Transcript_36453/g.114270 Transcript_36453/m.114270 type:complete len:200 (+) Transcript_36453:2075-2674(+)
MEELNLHFDGQRCLATRESSMHGTPTECREAFLSIVKLEIEASSLDFGSDAPHEGFGVSKRPLGHPRLHLHEWRGWRCVCFHPLTLQQGLIGHGHGVGAACRRRRRRRGLLRLLDHLLDRLLDRLLLRRLVAFLQRRRLWRGRRLRRRDGRRRPRRLRLLGRLHLASLLLALAFRGPLGNWLARRGFRGMHKSEIRLIA